MSGAPERIRVVLVDDSPLSQDVLCGMLDADERVRVVGTAKDGQAGLDLVRRHRPDVLLTDLHMPTLDGLGLTRAVMAEDPTPVVIVSGSTTEEDTFDLLAAGAVDVYLKPDSVTGPVYAQKTLELVRKVRVASGVSVFRRPPPLPVPVRATAEPVGPACMIALGASTGGPHAYRTILGALPSSFPVPVVCVQHITTGFLPGLVDWLSDACDLPVSIARHGERPQAGHVYFAPEERQLTFGADGAFSCVSRTPEGGHVPSVTTTFRAVAASCGNDAIGVLLTGMGDDGARGLQAMRERGALTIAQDAATSLVHGMPGEAIRLGAARLVLPLPEIAARLRNVRVQA